MNAPAYTSPRRRNTAFWIALAAILAAVGCLCAGGVMALLWLSSSPARPTPAWMATPTATPIAASRQHTPTPTANWPTATPVVAVPNSDQPTPTAAAEPAVVPFIPDLSGAVSAAFEFEKRSGDMLVTGDGQLLWPDRSVYETGGELYLAADRELWVWGDEQDGWVAVLPSARLHDNLISWLYLLSYATPTEAGREADGTTRVDFTIDVPDEAIDFGVRGLGGSGWLRWDEASSTLGEVFFDLSYLDRLGAALNSQLYMRFTSWNQPVVIPER